jgi:hypothetical protein
VLEKCLKILTQVTVGLAFHFSEELKLRIFRSFEEFRDFRNLKKY